MPRPHLIIPSEMPRTLVNLPGFAARPLQKPSASCYNSLFHQVILPFLFSLLREVLDLPLKDLRIIMKIFEPSKWSSSHLQIFVQSSHPACVNQLPLAISRVWGPYPHLVTHAEIRLGLLNMVAGKQVGREEDMTFNCSRSTVGYLQN